MVPAIQFRKNLAFGIAILLILSRQVAFSAPGNSWNKLRYQGGTVDAKVNPFDWNTTLTTRSGEIELTFAGRKKIAIAVADITAVSYGQKAYRRVADMAMLSLLTTPVALFGLLHKSKDHIVSIEFKDAGATGVVLLTVHKDSYRDLLETLRTLTGKPVENWP